MRGISAIRHKYLIKLSDRFLGPSIGGEKAYVVNTLQRFLFVYQDVRSYTEGDRNVSFGNLR